MVLASHAPWAASAAARSFRYASSCSDAISIIKKRAWQRSVVNVSHVMPDVMPDESNRPTGYFIFAGFIGVLLLLNYAGLFKTVFGIDTAIVITLVAGYKVFYNAIAGLLEREISADLAISIAAIAALASGEYLAGAQAMLIMLIGEGLEAYAVGRTDAAVAKLAALLPRHGR